MSNLLVGVVLLVAILFCVCLVFSDQPRVEDSLAHWHVTIPGLTIPHDRFYTQLSEHVRRLKLPSVEIRKLAVHEGHMVTFTRPYLRFRRGNLRYFVFAAPIGESFYVSTWLINQRSAPIKAFLSLPLIGWIMSGVLKLLSTDTLFEYDSALHFHAILHQSTVAAVDGLILAENAPALPAEAKKPILRELYIRPKAPQLAL